MLEANREKDLMELVATQADKLVDQAATITTLETQLAEARELARIGGWQSAPMGRGVEALLPGREG